MITIPNAIAVLFERRVIRPALCWRITRKDEVVLRFTSHDRNLTIDGDLYESVGGFSTTAVERGDSLREPNKTVRGALSSDAITEEDIRCGRYDGAVIREFIVDWKYPDAGQIVNNELRLVGLSWNGAEWEASLVGLKDKLNKVTGRRYNRTCPYIFGDPDTCTVNLDNLIRNETVVNVQSREELIITESTLTLVQREKNYFKRGSILFADPDSDLHGIRAFVRSSEMILFSGQPRIRVKLRLDLPKAPTAPEAVELTPGCDHTKAGGCTREGNIPNHGGHTFIPGSDGAFSTPFRL